MNFQAGKLMKTLNEEVGFDLRFKELARFIQIEWRENR